MVPVYLLISYNIILSPSGSNHTQCLVPAEMLFILYTVPSAWNISPPAYPCA